VVSLSSVVITLPFLQREGQRLSYAGGLFIGSQWLLMLTCVVLGAAGVVEWLDSLYIISYNTLITAVVKYIPLVR
jgi:quinol-cytochrome oxidoreductase complex cytochrome b subunit